MVPVEPLGDSALARLVARIGLVNDVHPAFSPHEAIVTVSLRQRLEGIAYLHSVTKIRNRPVDMDIGRTVRKAGK